MKVPVRFLRLALLALCFLWMPLASADLVKLKNGNEVTGKITYEDETGVTMELSIGGTMQFKRADIEAVEKREEVPPEDPDADKDKKDDKKKPPPKKPPPKKPPPKKPPPKR